MTPEFVSGFLFGALKAALLLSAPMLLAGLVAGVAVSMFQAATSISEMTLVFIPKMMAVGLALLVFFPWMLQFLMDYTREIYMSIPVVIQ